MAIVDNQQLSLLTREQLQVFLTARLGDGCIVTSNSNSTYYITNCKFEEYIDFKGRLLGNMFKKKTFQEENGFCKTPIYNMRSCSSNTLKVIKELPLENVINNLDELGIALWFYDDGSLHKTDLNYNLNTQKFSYEEHRDIFIPFFNRLGIYPKIRTENKKDGRHFYYLGINKYSGANIISEILSKYPVNCYSYKRWSSETIQKWSKMQEHLKSVDRQLTTHELGCLWRCL